MNIEYKDYAGFTVAGIGIRTSNAKATETIPSLWQRFQNDNVMASIPQKLDDSVLYGVYSQYENGKDGEYHLLIGTEVQDGTEVAEPLEIRSLALGHYAVFKVKSADDIPNVWSVIWQAPLRRTFRGDFERYGPDGIAIYVAIEPESAINSETTVISDF